MSTETFTPEGPEAQFFGHPRGLATLFFMELWERFSYYGMRGILVLFLVAAAKTGGFAMDAVTAGAIYGLYTASVYMVALPGGWIADRLMGQRNAVFVGGIIIAMGHFSMALPMTTTFYLGLILIVIGTGLLKPNVSTIVGELYPEGGARRDAGFSIFYMGINIGALIGPLICGWLGEKVNWHFGFSAAGIGMILGLIQYRLGMHHLGTCGVLKEKERERRPQAMKQLTMGILVVLLVAAVLALLHAGGIVTLTLDGMAHGIGVVIVSLALLYFAAVILFGGLEVAEKKRVFVIFILFVAAAMFWAGFEQAGSSMNLFADRLTDRTIAGFDVPASWLQSINPIFIIVLAPVFGWLWIVLQRWNPSMPLKFSYGLLLLGAGFFVMKWAAAFSVGDVSLTQIDGGNGGAAITQVSPMWLVATYFLHTCGELCLSPVGLSSVTKLAPKRYVGQMMGTWFMGAALGNLIAGLVGGQFEALPLPALFGNIAFLSGCAGVILLVAYRGIRRLMGGVE